MKVHELLIDFRITSICYSGCDLCFRNPGVKNSKLDDIKKIIRKMFDVGFRRIGFTGGEPTTRLDYLQMLTYAKGLGFLTYLSTVGESFIRDLQVLEDGVKSRHKTLLF